MLYLRHPAWLWLKKNDKNKLPEVDANLQAIFDTGHAFEPYAEQQFPEITRLGFSNFNEYRTLPARTEAALEAGAKTITQGRFEYQGDWGMEGGHGEECIGAGVFGKVDQPRSFVSTTR